MSASRRAFLSLLLAAPLSACGSGNSAPSSAAPGAAPTAPTPRKVKMVRLHTNFGPITLQLDATAAPETVANFLMYVEDGHYEGTLFHRVIDGFMIQGGGFTADMAQKPTRAPIQNEAANGLKNVAYSIAMARTPNPHSATSQFFINVADNGFLNHTAPSLQGWGYAVFGKVVAGTEVVDAIRGVKTGRKGFHDDVPLTDVVIEKAVAL